MLFFYLIPFIHFPPFYKTGIYPHLDILVKTLEADVTSFYIIEKRIGGNMMKQGDIILYGCVIIGAGVGLVFDAAFPGVLIGLGVGYVLQYFTKREEG